MMIDSNTPLHDPYSAVRGHTPRLKHQPSRVRAAVCVLLREHEGAIEFLLMQRAHHEHDPWSGQMAFPGGKIEPTDASAKAAAERETLEEVGVDAAAHQYLGQLNDVYGFKQDDTYIAHIASFVYLLTSNVAITANYEVADTVWLPLNYLNNPDNYLLYQETRHGIGDMPSIRINPAKGQVLWGLTLRIVVMLGDLMHQPLSALSEEILERIREIERREP